MAMCGRDYPIDGGQGLYDHLSGDKMLFEGPPDISPTVHVKGSIYFTSELLQQKSGKYFIPVHFLMTCPDPDMIAMELCGFGFPVECTTVSLANLNVRYTIDFLLGRFRCWKRRSYHSYTCVLSYL